jgi:hypothetical protein
MKRMFHCLLTVFVCTPVAYGTRRTNSITCFQTIDVFTSVKKDIVPKTGANTPIYLTDSASCELNIIANTKSAPSYCDEGKIKCVKIELGSYSRKEKVAHCTLFGDSPPEYHDENQPLESKN